jgi:hypothetical protein
VQEHSSALGEAVRQRREELGVSRALLRQRGGPSEPTVIRIEHGKLPHPSEVTLVRLDTALAWQSGSAKAVVDGGTPIPLASHERPWVPGAGSATISIDVVAALIGVADQLMVLARQERPDRLALAGVAQELGHILQPVYGSYVTHLLERNRSEAGALSPIVTMLDHLLTASDGDGDEERLYRRWLAGLAKVPPELAATFEARWKAATQ